MATITPQSKTSISKSFALAAANGGGDVVTNTDGGVVVMVQNGDASSKTITVKSYAVAIPEGTAKTDLAVVIAAGETALIGPLSAAAWNNGSKQVELTYSAVTSVKVAAYKGS